MLPPAVPHQELCACPAVGSCKSQQLRHLHSGLYCNSLLAGALRCQFDRLQSVLNTAAWLLVGAKKHDHIKQVLRDRLHWLPVPQRVQFKLYLQTCKCKTLHGLAPSYLADLCRPVISVGSRQRLRSATRGDLVISSTVTNFGDRSFAIAGPKAWNQLLSHIPTIQSVSSFKTTLKTFLFPSTIS